MPTPPTSTTFEERKAELLKPIRHHCTGCPSCQSDYGCALEAGMSMRMREMLFAEFPDRREDIFGEYEREQAALDAELAEYERKYGEDWLDD